MWDVNAATVMAKAKAFNNPKQLPPSPTWWNVHDFAVKYPQITQIKLSPDTRDGLTIIQSMIEYDIYNIEII